MLENVGRIEEVFQVFNKIIAYLGEPSLISRKREKLVVVVPVLHLNHGQSFAGAEDGLWVLIEISHGTLYKGG